MASTYCVRSLVPIEKKSTSRASSGRHQHRRRHLDHDADLDRLGAHLAARTSSAIALRLRAAPRASATIGNMIATGPGAEAR